MARIHRFPGIQSRRSHGKGRAFAGLSTAHDIPSGELIIHFIWDFVAPSERLLLCEASPTVGAYARLRHESSATDPAVFNGLRSMGPRANLSPRLSRNRAHRLAMLLLLFDFEVGDLVRWLGGTYTHDHIPLDPIRSAVAELRERPHKPGYPVQDFDRALHILEHGAPLQAAYVCDRRDTAARNAYDNHAGVSTHGPAVLKKILADSNNEFVLVFPRWVWRFIYGLFLSPIGFIVRKDKGRIVVDPSNHVHEDSDSGALNDQLDKSNTDEVPRTYYASAMRRHYTHIWNLRISHPEEDILLYKDDINSAFHRGRYHPDIAAAYAYVYGDWLVVPIGLIFGGRNSPGWFCLLSELRAHIAAHYPGLVSDPSFPLVDKITIPPPPPQAITAAFQQAELDSINPGAPAPSPGSTHHATFVDDNLMAEIHSHIRQSIQRSTGSWKVRESDQFHCCW